MSVKLPRPVKLKHHPLVDLVVYAVLRLLITVVHMFPVRVCLSFAKFAGEVSYRVLRKKREHARRNLKIAFGDQWSDAKIDAVALESFRHLAMLGVEMIFTTRLMSRYTWSRHVRMAPSTVEALRIMLEGRGPVALLTAHYGNWEIYGYTLATLGFTNHSIVRPIDNPRVDEFLTGARERTGQKLIRKRGATDQVREVIADKGILCVLGDPSGGRKGVFANFFGVATSCHKTIALMCLNERVPILVGFSRRLNDRFEFEFRCTDVIKPEEYDHMNRLDAVYAVTQRYTTAIEEMIREDPAQYMWVYRRFKSRSNAELSMCDDRWRDREVDILAGVAG